MSFLLWVPDAGPKPNFARWRRKYEEGKIVELRELEKETFQEERKTK